MNAVSSGPKIKKCSLIIKPKNASRMSVQMKKDA